MKISVTICVLFTISFIHATSSASFPKSWQRCRQTDPELNKCLLSAAQDAIRKLKSKGIPSLGVFPIDPLEVTAMDVLQGGEGPVSLNLKFNSMKIHGIAKSTLTEYNATLKDYSIYTKSITPAFQLVGNYSMNGRLLLLPIQGVGFCDITLVQLETDHYMLGEPVTTDGKLYMKIKEYKIVLRPQKLILRFDNLFNGDKRLGDTMNTFMNENWETIFKEIRPSLEASFGSLFKEMSNRIFTKLPFNEIFLP